MKTIYKFSCDVGRMGSLSGVFVAEPEAVEKVIGQNIYFGEVLGKHSEIDIDLERNDIVKVTDDPAFVELFEKYDLSSGYNPLDYYEEDEEGEYQYDEYNDDEDD